ncbi:MAG: type II secretion system protein [Inhella sp.]
MSLAQRGFGLLESIVAMALLGSAGLMLFAWIQSSYDTAYRIEQAQRRAQLQLEAQAFLTHLNPVRRPEGREELGGMTLEWTSALVEPMRTEFDYGGNLLPRWRLGLFDLKVKVRQDGVEAIWQQRAVGWESVGVWTTRTEP